MFVPPLNVSSLNFEALNIYKKFFFQQDEMGDCFICEQVLFGLLFTDKHCLEVNFAVLMHENKNLNVQCDILIGSHTSREHVLTKFECFKHCLLMFTSE